jgi:anthranilate phosphoribosyltransferase
VIGVFDKALCRPMAEVLQRLGSEHVMVVHASDGLDELTLSGTSYIAELKNGKINEYMISPEALGLSTTNLTGLSVSSAEESLNLIRDALGKKEGEHAQKAADIIALNAGAAVYVSGIANTLEEGVRMAEDAIGSGLAKAKIQDLAAFSDCCKI